MDNLSSSEGQSQSGSPYILREAEKLGLLKKGEDALRELKRAKLYEPLPVVKEGWISRVLRTLGRKGP